MFYHDRRLQYTVRVEKPNPLFAKMLQQALAGIEGELRVAMQYLMQAWNSRGDAKYRNMLLETGTEEMGHVEMYATAIALNLEGSTAAVQEAAARHNPLVAAVMGGMQPRQFLSAGMGALLQDSEGNPFNGSWVVGSGNIAADMLSNANAEATGIVLACRLAEMTDDPGMKDFFKFVIARDVMHQQQWLSVIEDLGGLQSQLPIPNSYDQSKVLAEFSHTFLSTVVGEDDEPPTGRFNQGPSIDGKGEYDIKRLRPMGQEPQLAPPIPEAFAQLEQMSAGAARIAAHGTSSAGIAAGGTAGSLGSEGIGTRIADSLNQMKDEITGRGTESAKPK